MLSWISQRTPSKDIMSESPLQIVQAGQTPLSLLQALFACLQSLSSSSTLRRYMYNISMRCIARQSAIQTHRHDKEDLERKTWHFIWQAQSWGSRISHILWLDYTVVLETRCNEIKSTLKWSPMRKLSCRMTRLHKFPTNLGPIFSMMINAFLL